MKRKPEIKEKLIDTALNLAAQAGWEGFSLRDLAKEAGITLAQLHECFEDKTDILAAFGRMIDRKVLVSMEVALDAETSPRDRLFDILMERYEALNDYRGGVVAILGSFCFDPKQAVIACPHLGRSMSWMLEAAGVDTGGMRGALKVVGLTALYLKVLRVWKEDESPDMAKVMAALDKDLARAERFAGLFGF